MNRGKDIVTANDHANASPMITPNLSFKKVRPMSQQKIDVLKECPNIVREHKMRWLIWAGLFALPSNTRYHLNNPPWAQEDKAHIPTKQHQGGNFGCLEGRKNAIAGTDHGIFLSLPTPSFTPQNDKAHIPTKQY